MTSALHAAVVTGLLADAAARMSRLFPARSVRPEHAGLLLRAGDGGLALLASDGEVTVRTRLPAIVHERGEVLVSRRGLVETLSRLDAPEVRLALEGSRLAVRTPGARFALPVLGSAGVVGEAAVLDEPGVLGEARVPAAELPGRVGEVEAGALRAAVGPVAGAASREHALPIFTGVRVRGDEAGLSLLATDRYRLARASTPWRPAGADLDVLVPAALFAEAARQSGGSGTVSLHAGGGLFGVSWAAGSVTMATLGAPFPDGQLDRLLDVRPVCTVEVDPEALAAAVERAAGYGGVHGRVGVEAADGALVLRASDPVAGESEESVKAVVRGDLVTRHFRARLLVDALRAGLGDRALLRIQDGMRATEVTQAPGGAGDVELRYLVVPMRHAADDPAD
jgi:DNA polymerase-3 subunit beta